jgi:hypothetical protein
MHLPIEMPISKMANLREGLQLPPTKEDIKNHSNRNSPVMGNRVNDVLEFVNNNLQDGANMTMFML